MKRIPIFIYAISIGLMLGLSHTACAVGQHHKKIADTVFVTKAGQGGLTEVQLGKIAERNAQSQDVKNFGAKMVTDHTKLNDELKAAVAKIYLPVPVEPSVAQRGLIDKLTRETGKQFDTDYVEAMLNAHRGDKALFTREIATTGNPVLKQFAETGLPVITEHLNIIEGIARTQGIAFGGHRAKKQQ